MGRTSYRDPSLTSLEVLPTVTLYGINHDPFGAGRTTKDALFSVEAHLTHNFSRRVWMSADLLYRLGGETRTDGMPDHNGARGLSGGLSAAVPLLSKSSLIFSYQHVIERRDNGPDGWFFRSAMIAGARSRRARPARSGRTSRRDRCPSARSHAGS